MADDVKTLLGMPVVFTDVAEPDKFDNNEPPIVLGYFSLRHAMRLEEVRRDEQRIYYQIAMRIYNNRQRPGSR